MAQKKFDGVVEAVRYAPDGRIELVRVYERRGPTFSDRVLLTRQDLISRLRLKQHFLVGRRVPNLASTFDLGVPVRLAGQADREVLVAGDASVDGDHLEGVPLF